MDSEDEDLFAVNNDECVVHCEEAAGLDEARFVRLVGLEYWILEPACKLEVPQLVDPDPVSLRLADQKEVFGREDGHTVRTLQTLSGQSRIHRIGRDVQ